MQGLAPQHPLPAKHPEVQRAVGAIGHQLGIETHDCRVDGPLVAGMVHTIEPGIYLPNRGVGIRIEDDILITESGNVNLTAAIPKTVEAIEAAMAAR